MVVLDIDGTKPPYPALPGTEWAITAVRANGPGSIKNFAVDGRLVFERVEWLVSCKLDHSVLVCDGNLLLEIPHNARWSCEELTAEDGCDLDLHHSIVIIDRVGY